jgi:hypothetical protein
MWNGINVSPGVQNKTSNYRVAKWPQIGICLYVMWRIAGLISSTINFLHNYGELFTLKRYIIKKKVQETLFCKQDAVLVCELLNSF